MNQTPTLVDVLKELKSILKNYPNKKSKENMESKELSFEQIMYVINHARQEYMEFKVPINDFKGLTLTKDSLNPNNAQQKDPIDELKTKVLDKLMNNTNSSELLDKMSKYISNDVTLTLTSFSEKTIKKLRTLINDGKLQIRDCLVITAPLITLSHEDKESLKDAIQLVRSFQMYEQPWFKTEPGDDFIPGKFKDLPHQLGAYGENMATDLTMELLNNDGLYVLCGRRPGTKFSENVNDSYAGNGGMLATGGVERVIANIVNEFLEEMCGGSILTEGSASLKDLSQRFNTDKSAIIKFINSYLKKHEIDILTKTSDLNICLQEVKDKIVARYDKPTAAHQQFLEFRIELYKEMFKDDFNNIYKFFEENRELREKVTVFNDERCSKYSWTTSQASGGVVDLSELKSLVQKSKLDFKAGDDLDEVSILPTDVFLMESWGAHSQIFYDEFMRNFNNIKQKTKRKDTIKFLGESRIVSSSLTPQQQFELKKKFEKLKSQKDNIELIKEIYEQIAILHLFLNTGVDQNDKTKMNDQSEIVNKIEDIYQEFGKINKLFLDKNDSSMNEPKDRNSKLKEILVTAKNHVQELNSPKKKSKTTRP